uniref:PH domain-containing protein n=1 Tax=Anopheles christyi TaxID=43041 RepID=A0A182JYM1_9DIPT
MMTERRSDFVLKSGYMVKRSQNKKRFTPVNYKTRWFELTRFYLSYYDIGNLEVSVFGPRSGANATMPKNDVR